MITITVSLEDYLNILTALRMLNNPKCDQLITVMADTLAAQILAAKKPASEVDELASSLAKYLIDKKAKDHEAQGST